MAALTSDPAEPEMAGERRPAKRAAPADPEPEAAAASRRRYPALPPLVSPTLTVETQHLTRAHTLRSRKVFVPRAGKPGPPEYRKGEQRVYDTSWQTPSCAKAALEHFNRLNEDDQHELVRAVDSAAFLFNGLWMHANFLAKLKGGTTCVDLVPKHFFAELRAGPKEAGMSCVSCVKMDPADPETAPVRGCRMCPSRIFHPAAGGHRGGLVDGENKKGGTAHGMANKNLFGSLFPPAAAAAGGEGQECCHPADGEDEKGNTSTAGPGTAKLLFDF